MCGILTITGNNADKINTTVIDAALATLGKRGPDDIGTLTYPNCILAQTRLSIIDLAGGHQPMKDNKLPLTITFNGEIYNYKSLKTGLEKKGHHFSTTSDTEVILKAYAEYGEHCVDHLDGMFAFAIWNEKDRSLFLARDRFGEKPLYYAFADSGKNGAKTLIVASEIKAILATGMVGAEVDMTSVDNYLTLMCVPVWRTIYKDITPLPPAHTALWKNGQLSSRRYWQLKKTAPVVSDDEAGITLAAKTVRTMLIDSVKSRMVADVEVGTLLSGGIDSSIITSLSQEVVSNDGSHRKVKAFSAGFEDLINELPYAEEIAKLSGVEHHEKQIKTDLVKSFISVSSYFDQPFSDSSNIPMHLISGFAREKVKVVLSGDGGDELFYGYGHYRRHWHMRKDKLFWLELRRAWAKLFSDPFTYYKNFKVRFNTFTVSERKKLWKDTSVIEKDPVSHVDLSEATTSLEKINLVDFYMTLPGDMLAKVDTASMMHSLEVRSPFLNHKLAEYAFNLPERFKATRAQGKIILSHAFGDLIPAEFFTRKKSGFNAPIKPWLHKPEIKRYVEEALLKEPSIAAFLKMRFIQKTVRDFYAGKNVAPYKVWTLLSLETWMRTRTIKPIIKR